MHLNTGACVIGCPRFFSPLFFIFCSLASVLLFRVRVRVAAYTPVRENPMKIPSWGAGTANPGGAGGVR